MTPLRRFRLVALAEGISYLLLLFIAMPLKYLADMPGPVRATGSIHGALFVAFCVTLAHAAFARRWSLVRIVIAFVSSLVPFGTFVFDRSLRAEEEAGTAEPRGT